MTDCHIYLSVQSNEVVSLFLIFIEGWIILSLECANKLDAACKVFESVFQNGRSRPRGEKLVVARVGSRLKSLT